MFGGRPTTIRKGTVYNMADYVISCESMADLSAEKFAEIDVKCIYFHYSIDGKQHLDDLGQSVPFSEFYQAMRDGAETKTSAIGVGEYEAFFCRYLEQGKDLIHVSLSSGISATVNSARIAARQAAEKYPERTVYVVDSLAASSGFGLLLQGMADQRDAGMDIDELFKWTEANKKRVQHWFFSTDLTFFIKGGRVKPVAGYVGNLLGICPLLNVDFEGKLIPREKLRGKKKVIQAIVDRMAEHAEGGEHPLFFQRVAVCQYVQLVPCILSAGVVLIRAGAGGTFKAALFCVVYD